MVLCHASTRPSFAEPESVWQIIYLGNCELNRLGVHQQIVFAHGQITCQFGAFLFGARQFDACQFGVLHFDAVPVRRVSVWRDASLARCQFGAFHFGAFPICVPNCTEVFSMWVWRLCWSSMRVWCVARAAYTFVGMFSFCEEVFFMRVSIFCVFFLCVSCIISILILSTCHRGYTIADLFISRLRLQNGCATQRDVGVVIVQCTRSEDLKTFLLHLFDWWFQCCWRLHVTLIYSCSVTM